MENYDIYILLYLHVILKVIFSSYSASLGWQSQSNSGYMLIVFSFIIIFSNCMWSYENFIYEFTSIILQYHGFIKVQTIATKPSVRPNQETKHTDLI